MTSAQGMRVTTQLVGVVATLGAACAEPEPITLPESPGILATVVVLERGGVLSAEGIEGDGHGRTLPSDRSEDWVADILGYEQALGALGLNPGPLAEALPGAPGRPLPPFLEGTEVQIKDGRSLGFQSLSALEGPAGRFRLALPDPRECLNEHGCLDLGEVPRCLIPCPEPSAIAAPTAPTPATRPAGPQLGPCPDGWSFEESAGVQVCAPPARRSCAATEVQWIADVDCGPFASCVAGRWPENLPAGTLYVDANAAPGDGSAQAPFNDLAFAWAAAPPGATLALARGEYAGALNLDRPVQLIGACPAETVLRDPVVVSAAVALQALSFASTLRVDAGAQASLHSLRLLSSETGLQIAGVVEGSELQVLGARSGGVEVESGGQATINRLLGQDLLPTGIHLAERSQAELSEVLLEDLPGGQSGVFVEAGGILQIHRSALLRTSFRAVELRQASLVATDLVIQETLSLNGRGGVALHATTGATLALSRAWLSQNQAIAVLLERQSRGQLEDLVVTETAAREDDQLDGESLVVASGTRLALRRAVLDRGTDSGVLVHDLGTQLELEDVTISNTRPRTFDGVGGSGLVIDAQAEVTAARLFVHGCRSKGVGVHERASLTATDLVIEDTNSEQRSGQFGRGLWVSGDAHVSVVRMETRRNRRAGIELSSPASSTLEDVYCERTEASLAEEITTPTCVRVGAGQVQIDRLGIGPGRDTGLAVTGLGTTLRVDDLSISGSEGRGVRLSLGGVLSGRRWRVDANGSLELEVESGALADGEDAVFSGAVGQSDQVGQGISVEYGSLRLNRFRVENNGGFGLSLGNSDLALTDGAISGHQVGVLLGATGVELNDLLRRVQFHDNATDISR